MKKRWEKWIWRGLSMMSISTLICGCGAPAGSGAPAGTAQETRIAQETRAAQGTAEALQNAEEGIAGERNGLAEAEKYAGDQVYPAKAPEIPEAALKSDGMRMNNIMTEEEFNTEEYNYISENGYKSVMDEPLSTFSIDVDTASYGNIRRMLKNHQSIPADAVRIEEMINYFSYDYPEPKEDIPFSVTTEYTDCPWNEDSRLLMIGLQAKEIDFTSRPDSNLVFLLDVSGSMYGADRLPLVQKSFLMLTESLTENDKVSIVTYAGNESVVLDGVSGSQKAKIAAALEDLEAGGSTAGAAGIQKAYELAEKNYIPGGNNRIILATDGDLNVGISSESELTRLVQEKKKGGVHLSVLGVGSGNIKDNKMEALADNGDGNYSYLDSLYEAKKVLVDEMGGTLITVAKDVKIQVEFNPEYVSSYRLIGYENRLLNQEDFHNDKVDAGEIGSGHSVTALYEIVPAKGEGTQTSLKYQTSGTVKTSSELLTVSLRYKAPNGDSSKLLEYPVEADTYQEEWSENLAFAAAVAEFGMILRDSEYKGSSTYDSVMELAEPCVRQSSDDYRKEFLTLVETAKNNQ